MQVDESETPSSDNMTPSKEMTNSSQDGTEKVHHQALPNIPKPRAFAVVPGINQHIDYIPMGGSRSTKDEIFRKKIDFKRRCSRSSEGSSSPSEDWTVDFSQTAETITTTTSVSGSHDNNSVADAKVGMALCSSSS